MVLVLDNAAYHHWMGHDGFKVSGLRKVDLADKLMTLCKLALITVKRPDTVGSGMKEVSFPDYTWKANGSLNSPSCEESRAKLKECLKADPNLNPSKVRKVFNRHKYQLIYTPPYLPDVQPIERAWAYVKNYVASRFTRGRTMQELLAQIRQGFYGDGKDHVGLDAVLAKKIIRHSNDFCRAWIESDDSLEGDLESLTTQTEVTPPDAEDEIEAELDPLAFDDDEDENED